MKNFFDSLMAETQAKLKAIQLANPEPLPYAAQSVKTLVRALETLKSHFLANPPQTKAEEVAFFRDLKPQLAAQLIYHNELYSIAANQPIGKKAIRKYYGAQLRKIKAFHDENAGFCKYIRTGNHSLDHKYFLRRKHDVRLTLDSSYLQADPRFSTSHDYTLARLQANERLIHELEARLRALENPIQMSQPKLRKLQWTGSKVALTELIYALHAEAVFNNGTADLKEVMALFESMFGIDLGQFNRTFIEIRARKSDRTKFLSALTQTLVDRMDQADEQ